MEPTPDQPDPRSLIPDPTSTFSGVDRREDSQPGLAYEELQHALQPDDSLIAPAAAAPSPTHWDEISGKWVAEYQPLPTDPSSADNLDIPKPRPPARFEFPDEVRTSRPATSPRTAEPPRGGLLARVRRWLSRD